MKSGLYIVRLLNNNPMPVTRDPRYVDACARVSSDNIKVGKAKDFDIRQKNYWKDFDKKNVVFEPPVKLDDINTAERAVLQKLKKYRKLSPKGGKLEWLEGITYENAKKAVFEALDESKISFVPIDEV